jgi:spermidine synthase
MTDLADLDDTLPAVALSESDGVRYLHLGTVWVQGAMRIRTPQVVELLYVQRMLAALLWLNSDELGQGQAVQLGLGAGALTRFTWQQLGMPTTVVEINPQVIAACKRFFHINAALSPVPLVVQCADAGAWLAAQQPGGWARLLHVDLYDHDAAAPVLDSEAFYADCKRLLAPGGLMSVNLFGRHASFAQSAARVAQAFGADQVWHMQPTREGNTALIAGRGVTVPDAATLRQRAVHIEARFGALGLLARRWLHQVRPYVL